MYPYSMALRTFLCQCSRLRNWGVWIIFSLYICDFRLTSRANWDLPSSGMLHRVNWYLPTFRDSLSVPLSWSRCIKRNGLLSFIHSVFCLTTGPKPPPKRFLHTVRSRTSYFKWEYPLLTLRSSSSFLRLLPRLLATSISPFIFPSITCFRRQFLRKMWPIQLAFRFLISCRIFLCSLALSNTSSFLTCSVQLLYPSRIDQ